MDVTCPNCGKGIHLVGAKELKEEFSLGPNSVAHARERGRFPMPWLSFQNRNIWIREEIEEYIRERSAARVEQTVDELLRALDHLPADARREAQRRLEKAGLGKKA